ncbi:hypothetical protein Lesp02_73130 [Lentzea sp. NBRC 105346]|nr:hypothetical protein Lesp02_73130 [Lentzea sp. NBRC 105346]
MLSTSPVGPAGAACAAPATAKKEKKNAAIATIREFIGKVLLRPGQQCGRISRRGNVATAEALLRRARRHSANANEYADSVNAHGRYCGIPAHFAFTVAVRVNKSAAGVPIRSAG